MLTELISTLAYLAGIYLSIPTIGLLLKINDWLVMALPENHACILLLQGEFITAFFVSRERHIFGKGRGRERYEIKPGESPRLWPKVSRYFFLGGLRFKGFLDIFYPLLYLHVASKFLESIDENGKRIFTIELESRLLSTIPMITSVEAFPIRITLGNGIQLNVVILATVEKMNPVRMVYGRTHWFEALRQEVTAKASAIISREDFEKLANQREKLEEKILQSLPYQDGSASFECGARVSHLRIQAVDPVTDKDAEVLLMLTVGTRRAQLIEKISRAIKEAGAEGLPVASMQTLEQLQGHVTLIGRDVATLPIPVPVLQGGN